MGPQGRVEMVQQANVAGVIQALAFLEEPGPGHEAFHLVLALFGHVSLFCLEVCRVITARREPAPRYLVVVVDEHDIGLA